MPNDFQPPWRSPTNWLGSTPFPSAPPTPPPGKLSYADWYNQNGKNMVQSVSFGSPAESYLDYLNQAGSPQSPNPTAPGTGTVPGGLGGTIDTVYQQPGLPTYGPGGTVPGGYKAPNTPTQNQGTSPFQNTQYNPLTPYNFMSIGGQGSMNQFNPFQSNDPAGGTMMNQSQGFYKSLPNYGFYQ